LRLLEFEEYAETNDLLQKQAAYGYNAHSLVGIARRSRQWSCPQIDGRQSRITSWQGLAGAR